MLAERITDNSGTFELQRLPPDAEPYVAVLSIRSSVKYSSVDSTMTSRSTASMAPSSGQRAADVHKPS